MPTDNRNSHYSPVDIVIMAYYLIVGVFILISGLLGRLDNWWFYTLHHLLVLILIPTIIVKLDAKKRDIRSFIRLAYPLFLFGGMYRETHNLDQVIFTRPLDYYFIEWDRILFKCQPCVEFATRWSAPWFSEIIHALYGSYFIIIVLLPLVWWFRKRPDMVHRRVFDLTFTYIIFYMIFIILPVQGPRVQLPEAVNIPRVGYLFAPFFEFLFSKGGIAGAAFPSSHCGIATVVAAYSFRDIPKAWPIPVILALGIYFATVYGRFHYAVDVFYGVGLGLICSIVSGYVYNYFRSRGFTGPINNSIRNT